MTKQKDKRFTNIMLAAGKGERFKKDYLLPKPLVLIDGKPMVIRAAEFLPNDSENFFICLKDHIEEPYAIDKEIKRAFPGATVISLSKVTQGQANTCLYAKEYIAMDTAITVGSCDCGVTYNQKKFRDLLCDKETDALIWTFRKNSVVENNPNAWGWVKSDDRGFVTKISVKIPLSKSVINDHAIIGWFSFKKAYDCFNEIEKMIAEKDMVNNEYYLDTVLQRLVKKGKNVRVFEVDTYLGWGTPDAIKLYKNLKG